MKKIFTLAAAACFAGLSASAQTSYTLRTLTFEDKDYASDSANYLGKNNWSSLIDSPQYGGELLYGENHGNTSKESTDVNYKWYDKGNTYLYSEIPENWGTKMYWGGGHAISNYWDGNLNNGDYTHQLAVYTKDNTANGQGGHGHNGSNNFAVHYGYRDDSGYSASNLPAWKFGDGVARTIDHMYVNINTYLANAILNGNGLTSKLGPDDYIDIEATGYHEDGSKKTIAFNLANGETVVNDWTKWNMEGLGKVKRVEFNVVGSNDNGYGFSQPAYFCYDDVAVRFSNADVTSSNARGNNIIASQSDNESVSKSMKVTTDSWFTQLEGDVPEGIEYTTVGQKSEYSEKDVIAFTDEGKYSEITFTNLPVGFSLQNLSFLTGPGNQRTGKLQITAFNGGTQIGELKVGGLRTDYENKLTFGNQYGEFGMALNEGQLDNMTSLRIRIDALSSDAALENFTITYTINDDHTDATVATFDDLTLEPESSWYGPADNAVEGTDDYGATVWNGTFKSGAYEFVNSINPTYGSWTGCSYSNMTATTYSDYSTDQWNSCAGHGATGSANYGVIYCGMPAGMPMEVIKVLDAPEGRVINGLNLTNSAWVVECVKNGNGVAKKFEQGSWFKVTFTGTKADNTTASVDYYLADYRSENEADWTCLTDWDWLDLSSLGKVVSLSISFDGSDKSYGYMNTSTYVCIDNVGCTKNTSTAIATAKPNYVELHEVARYTLDGKRIYAPQKGINIIRMSDGSTRKVVIE